ncbi:uncharacterized protein LOC106056038 isoform X1 [Biomphalaria glabrata]|uniref:Uncharacterized protein LOC106056038 isoform X1 n=2 Tax=Biomphalaria glabrata TaxID=6526 RepID=A0A9W2ZFW0_BIOGL|nr:uncharacterized protein LOC106056038 isoform X1 [Biomphalaria glabrata]
MFVSFLLVVIVVCHHALPECPVGWFGSLCNKICRCENLECETDGECKTKRCLPGFFGKQCQYVDSIMSAEVSQEELKSRNATKCQTSFIALSPLVIKFNSETRISGIQIEGFAEEDLLGLALTFVQTPNKSCYKGPCQRRRDIYLDPNTLVINCDIGNYVCQLNITFEETKIERRLCAVYVRGGRNLALKQVTTMSTSTVNETGMVSDGSLAVDGRLDECAATRDDDPYPTLILHFYSSVVLSEIVIYFRPSKESQIFLLQLHADENDTIMEYRGEVHPRVSLVPTPDRFIRILELSLQHANAQMTVCELEAYGECAPPMFGPDCTDICSLECKNYTCSYEGYCRYCKNQTKALHCVDCLKGCGARDKIKTETTDYVISGLRVSPVLSYIMIIIFICVLIMATTDGVRGFLARKNTLVQKYTKEVEKKKPAKRRNTWTKKDSIRRLTFQAPSTEQIGDFLLLQSINSFPSTESLPSETSI